MQIPDYIERSARYFGGRPAVVQGAEVLTYSDLFRRACRLANVLLGHGLSKGDRVAIQAWNSPRAVEFECALYLAGLVRVPINARQTPSETLELLADAGARAIVSEAGMYEVVIRSELEADAGATSAKLGLRQTAHAY